MEERNKYMDELIMDYLTEGLDDASLQELKQWISASPEHKRYFSRQLEIWSSAVGEKEKLPYDKEKAFDVFKKRVRETQVAERKQQIKPTVRLENWWRYVAVIAVVGALSCLAYWYGSETVKADFAEMTVEAPMGSRTKLYLPDGTLVWLNSGSRMTYSQGFGVEDRNVHLMGEGYFEVQPNKELPFKVQTQTLCVKVLGTKFNFRDYVDDDEAIVSLLEGEVTLSNLMRAEKELALAPNERVVLNKRIGKMQLEKAVPTNSTEWTKGYLFFDEELLPDIVKELARSYNVQIDIQNDALKEFRFYGNFVRRQQDIVEVLEALSATGKIRYKIEEDRIILY